MTLEGRRPPALLVDVDGTLVLWQGTYDERGREDWIPNRALVSAIERYLWDNPRTVLVVWSGGGEAYAQEWGARVLGHEDFTPLAKMNAIRWLEAGDVAVDDATELAVPLGGRAVRLLTPEAFVAEVAEVLG